MSRIGKKPIPLPSVVQVAIEGNNVTVKGPRGQLSRTLDPTVGIERKDNQLVLTRANEEKRTRAMHGLYRSLVNNMVVGVSQGYAKSLEIVGVGYRAAQQGTNVSLQVGYSKPVIITPLEGIQLEVEGANRIHVRGAAKEIVGLQAAKIRRIRPPDRYKGKGVRYVGEVVHIKPGKGGRKA